ncbi:unnamed protein product, partial [Scytosiphon promiscuus]
PALWEFVKKRRPPSKWQNAGDGHSDTSPAASSWREAGHTLWLPLIRRAKWHSEVSVRD